MMIRFASLLDRPVQFFLLGILGLLLAILANFFPMLWIVGAGVLGGLGLMVMRKPMLGIVLIAVTLPLERIGAYEWGGETTIRLSQIFAMMSLVAWVGQGLLKKSFAVRMNPIGWLMMFFLGVNLLSLVNAENVDRGFAVLSFLAFTMLVSAIVNQLVSKKNDLQMIIQGLLIGFLLVTLFGIFQFVGDMLDLPQTLTGLRDHYTKEVLGFPRVQSTALEPLYFANYLLLPLGVLFSWFWSKGRPLPMSVVLGLLALGGINFVLTLSRGGYLAGLAMMMVIALFYIRQWFDLRRLFLGLVILLALGAGTIRFLGTEERWETFSEHTLNLFYGASYSERIENYEKAWVAFQEHPWIGIGIGGFGPRLATHPYLAPEGGWKIVNSEPFELLAESGIFGFGLFAWIVVVVLVRSIRAIDQASDPYLKSVLIGLCGAFVGVLVQYQTFSVLYILHVWFLIGLLVAVQQCIFKPDP